MANGYGSRNMGRGTDYEAIHRFPSRDRDLSPGLPVATKCLHCGEKKHSSTPHPKCSRALQRKHQQGLL